VAHAPRLNVRIEEHRYDSPVSVALVTELLDELLARYGFADPDPDHLDVPQLAAPHGTFVLAWIDTEAVGCGALRRADERVGEIKRMYVRPARRGQGVGRAVLLAVEARAREQGYERLILETGTLQPEAIALYASSGYEPIPSYGAYRWSPLSRCFGRTL
jgi:GNAT superfamily N-acetyltransferase